MSRLRETQLEPRFLPLRFGDSKSDGHDATNPTFFFFILQPNTLAPPPVQPKPEVVEGNQGCHKKGLSFGISYTKFHDLNSIHLISVTDHVRHVVGWRIRKICLICHIMAIAFRIAKGQSKGSRFQLRFTKFSEVS